MADTLDRLISARSGDEPRGRVFFCNSGAEANEAAIKLARKWGGRGKYGVISAFGSFHGRTLVTLHATGQPSKHEAFQPLPEGFRYREIGEILGINTKSAAEFLRRGIRKLMKENNG